MLGNLFKYRKVQSTELLSSRLFDDRTFCPAFLNDMRRCKDEVIIESPFVSGRRMKSLMPIFQGLAERDVKITVNTRDPQEHDEYLRLEAFEGKARLQELGCKFFCFLSNIHSFDYSFEVFYVKS